VLPLRLGPFRESSQRVGVPAGQSTPFRINPPFEFLQIRRIETIEKGALIEGDSPNLIACLEGCFEMPEITINESPVQPEHSAFALDQRISQRAAHRIERLLQAIAGVPEIALGPDQSQEFVPADAGTVVACHQGQKAEELLPGCRWGERLTIALEPETSEGFETDHRELRGKI
jgi:hypothetical protein